MNYLDGIDKLISQEKIELATKKLTDIPDNYLKYYYIAEIKRISGLLKDSIRFYEKSLSDNKNMDKIKYNSLIKLASVHRALGNIDKAKKIIEEIKKIKNKNIDAKLEIAMFYRMKGDFKKSIIELKKILLSYRKINDFQGISYVQWAIAGIYRLIGDYKNAIEKYKNSIKYAQMAKDKSLKIYSLLGLAGTSRIYGKVIDSYKTYFNARKIIKKDDIFAMAYVHCGMGNALRQMGEIDKAWKNYKKAYKLYLKTGDKLELSLVMWGMGECYKRRGNIKEAIKIFKRTRKLFKSGFEPRGYILNEISISNCLYLMGKIDEAKRIYLNAIKLADKHSLNTYLEIFT